MPHAGSNEARVRPPLVLCLPMFGAAEAVAEAGFRVAPWPTDEEGHARLLAVAGEVEAVVTVGTRPLSAEFLAAAGRLGLICCLGAGYEAFDPAQLAARGVRLVNAGDVNAEDVADLAIGLLIAAIRRIVEADGWVRNGRWPQAPVFSRRLRGRRLGIVGLGSIGTAVAQRSQAMGMEIGWWGPRPKASPWARHHDCAALARWADILVVCCRPTLENTGMIDAAVLDALGPEGLLINVARGSLVDEPALIAALEEGRIAAAALDVFAEEPTDPGRWRTVPNLTLHPHGGGATFEALADARAAAVENLRRHFAGVALLNQVG